MKRLYKSNSDIKIDGVCSGLAEYLNLDPTLVRVIWLVAVLIGGTGVLAYFLCSIIVPRKPKDGSYEVHEEKQGGYNTEYKNKDKDDNNNNQYR